ncbi:uncharacterized protein LOC117603757 [Osmia lignaria lignaria]|uniref:uncharacterized protein LOC117603757 n=1 Tax=Osmia lignaria lignaria TaxID=1437193 RepID=UPI00402BEC2A
MSKEVYTDLSIISAKIFLRIAGVWIAMNNAEEFRRKISLLNVAILATYSLFVNTMNIHYFWGNDISYCVYCFCNVLCITLALSKVTVLRIRRFELAEVVAYAEKHFWHYNYNAQEQLYFAQCQAFCKFLIYFVLIIPVFVLFSYVITPILSNVGLNKSERVLIFEVRSSWPLRETPYYEILFTWQSDTCTSRRLLFVFHVLGSFIHLMIFTYTCHGLMEESTNIITAIYFGSWNTLPMDKIGRSLRSDMKMIMTRSLKPCRLTAGGFFPVSLETFTGLASSTFSYFTLLRESFMRNEG